MAIGDLRISSILRCNALTRGGSVGAYTVVRTRLYLANEAAFEPVIKEVTYEGDGTETTVYRATSFNVTPKFQSLPAGLATAFGKTGVTTGLPSGETERIYWMTDADAGGVVAGLEVICSAIDDTNNSTLYLAIVAPVGTLSTLTPPSVKSNDKSEMELKFGAKKTAVDIAGAALPSVPTGGCYWWYATLSAIPS